MSNSSFSALKIKRSNILQAVGSTFTGTEIIATGSNNTWYEAANPSLTITPTRSDSIIVLMLFCNLNHNYTTSNIRNLVRILRDGATGVVGTGGSALDITAATPGEVSSGSNAITNHCSIIAVDSVGDTSSHTYTMSVAREGLGTNRYINRTQTDIDSDSWPRFALSFIALEVLPQ